MNFDIKKYQVSGKLEVINKYIIKFVNHDGTELQSLELEYGEIPVYSGEEPTKNGNVQYSYVFDGWTPKISEVDGEKTYTAKFDEILNKYNITFVNYNETVLQESEFEYGTIPTYDGVEPIKEKTAQYMYTFAGWHTDVVAVTGEMTYIAMFNETLNSYTVTWVNYDNTELEKDDKILPKGLLPMSEVVKYLNIDIDYYKNIAEYQLKEKVIQNVL